MDDPGSDGSLITNKVLGQLEALVTTLQDVYTVPAAKTAVVSTVMVCNRNAAAQTFRMSIAVAGAADAVAQYIYYGQAIDGNTSFASTIGIVLGPGDVVRFWGTGGNFSVSVFGVEEP